MPDRSQPDVSRFLLWALVGAGVCLGLLSAATIGVFVLPLALMAGGLLIWRGGLTVNIAGALSGTGVIPLYISWLNRDGPGEVCTSIPSGQECTGEWSPWPWLLAGLAFVAAGIIVWRWLGRIHRPSSTPAV